MLLPWSIRLQLDFHIDQNQIKEIKENIAKFTSIVSKYCVFTYLYFQQMLLPWNIRLQLDFHIVDQNQIKKIPGKIRQLRDIYFKCIFGAQVCKYFLKSLANIYPNLNAIFAFVFISIRHIPTI